MIIRWPQWGLEQGFGEVDFYLVERVFLNKFELVGKSHRSHPTRFEYHSGTWVHLNLTRRCWRTMWRNVGTKTARKRTRTSPNIVGGLIYLNELIGNHSDAQPICITLHYLGWTLTSILDPMVPYSLAFVFHIQRVVAGRNLEGFFLATSHWPFAGLCCNVCERHFFCRKKRIKRQVCNMNNTQTSHQTIFILMLHPKQYIVCRLQRYANVTTILVHPFSTPRRCKSRNHIVKCNGRRKFRRLTSDNMDSWKAE